MIHNKIKSLITHTKSVCSFPNPGKISVKGNFKASVLRHYQNDALKEISEQMKAIKTVLNIGARQLDSDKEGCIYKDYFKGLEYYTLDKNKNENNSYHFNLDLHDLSSLPMQFDLVICMNTLEHVKNPFQVAEEVTRIVKPNGYLFISTPFFYPIHKELACSYSDYWRFTDDAIRVLFGNLNEVWIRESPSVIKRVEDRARYWESEYTPSGYLALFKN